MVSRIPSLRNFICAVFFCCFYPSVILAQSVSETEELLSASSELIQESNEEDANDLDINIFLRKDFVRAKLSWDDWQRILLVKYAENRLRAFLIDPDSGTRESLYLNFDEQSVTGAILFEDFKKLFHLRYTETNFLASLKDFPSGDAQALFNLYWEDQALLGKFFIEDILQYEFSTEYSKGFVNALFRDDLADQHYSVRADVEDGLDVQFSENDVDTGLRWVLTDERLDSELTIQDDLVYTILLETQPDFFVSEIDFEDVHSSFSADFEEQKYASSYGDEDETTDFHLDVDHAKNELTLEGELTGNFLNKNFFWEYFDNSQKDFTILGYLEDGNTGQLDIFDFIYANHIYVGNLISADLQHTFYGEYDVGSLDFQDYDLLERTTQTVNLDYDAASLTGNFRSGDLRTSRLDYSLLANYPENNLDVSLTDNLTADTQHLFVKRDDNSVEGEIAGDYANYAFTSFLDEESLLVSGVNAETNQEELSLEASFKEPYVSGFFSLKEDQFNFFNHYQDTQFLLNVTDAQHEELLYLNSDLREDFQYVSVRIDEIDYTYNSWWEEDFGGFWLADGQSGQSDGAIYEKTDSVTSLDLESDHLGQMFSVDLNEEESSYAFSYAQGDGNFLTDFVFDFDLSQNEFLSEATLLTNDVHQTLQTDYEKNKFGDISFLANLIDEETGNTDTLNFTYTQNTFLGGFLTKDLRHTLTGEYEPGSLFVADTDLNNRALNILEVNYDETSLNASLDLDGRAVRLRGSYDDGIFSGELTDFSGELLGQISGEMKDQHAQASGLVDGAAFSFERNTDPFETAHFDLTGNDLDVHFFYEHPDNQVLAQATINDFFAQYEDSSTDHILKKELTFTKSNGELVSLDLTMFEDVPFRNLDDLIHRVEADLNQNLSFDWRWGENNEEFFAFNSGQALFEGNFDNNTFSLKLGEEGFVAFQSSDDSIRLNISAPQGNSLPIHIFEYNDDSLSLNLNITSLRFDDVQNILGLYTDKNYLVKIQSSSVEQLEDNFKNAFELLKEGDFDEDALKSFIRSSLHEIKFNPREIVKGRVRFADKDWNQLLFTMSWDIPEVTFTEDTIVQLIEAEDPQEQFYGTLEAALSLDLSNEIKKKEKLLFYQLGEAITNDSRKGKKGVGVTGFNTTTQVAFSGNSSFNSWTSQNGLFLGVDTGMVDIDLPILSNHSRSAIGLSSAAERYYAYLDADVMEDSLVDLNFNSLFYTYRFPEELAFRVTDLYQDSYTINDFPKSLMSYEANFESENGVFVPGMVFGGDLAVADNFWHTSLKIMPYIPLEINESDFNVEIKNLEQMETPLSSYKLFEYATDIRTGISWKMLDNTSSIEMGKDVSDNIFLAPEFGLSPDLKAGLKVEGPHMRRPEYIQYHADLKGFGFDISIYLEETLDTLTSTWGSSFAKTVGKNTYNISPHVALWDNAGVQEIVEKGISVGADFQGNKQIMSTVVFNEINRQMNYTQSLQWQFDPYGSNALAIDWSLLSDGQETASDVLLKYQTRW